MWGVIAFCFSTLIIGSGVMTAAHQQETACLQQKNQQLTYQVNEYQQHDNLPPSDQLDGMAVKNLKRS